MVLRALKEGEVITKDDIIAPKVAVFVDRKNIAYVSRIEKKEGVILLTQTLPASKVEIDINE